MSDYMVRPAPPGLDGIRALYDEVAFRPDLIDDLALVLRLGGCVFVATTNAGETVGASSCLPFRETGWVGGVAVLPQHRARGLGERLTRAAVTALDERGIAAIFLNATSAAERLYYSMGFQPEGAFVEWVGAAPVARPVSPHVRPATAEDLDSALEIDQQVTGEDRGTLLRFLWPNAGYVFEDREVRGYCLPQIPSALGAVLATQGAAGHALLTTALAARSGPTRVAVPVELSATNDLLRGLGYRKRLPTRRMRLGPAVPYRHDQLFSAFNLYWG